MPTTIAAHLDPKVRVDRGTRPDGPKYHRVLCGRQHNGHYLCGGQLGRVFTVPTQVWSEDGVRIDRWERVIQIGPGWQQDDHGVWTMTPRARKQLQRLHSVATGNPRTSLHVSANARSKLKEMRLNPYRRGIDETGSAAPIQGLYVVNAEDLPVEARCPKCGGINRLDPTLVAWPTGDDPLDTHDPAPR